MIADFPTMVAVSGVNQQTAAFQPDLVSWVSGDIKNLGPTLSQLVLFDLGINWAQYPKVFVYVNFSTSALTGATAGLYSNYQVAAANFSTAQPLNNPNATARFSVFNGDAALGAITSGEVAFMIANPMGRQFFVRVTNSDAAASIAANANVAIACYTE